MIQNTIKASKKYEILFRKKWNLPEKDAMDEYITRKYLFIKNQARYRQ